MASISSTPASRRLQHESTRRRRDHIVEWAAELADTPMWLLSRRSSTQALGGLEKDSPRMQDLISRRMLGRAVR
jgi:hypothetical protein